MNAGWVLVAGLLLAGGCASSGREETPVEEHWEIFTIDGEHVGYSQQRSRPLDVIDSITESLTVFRMGEQTIRAEFFYEWGRNGPAAWHAFGYKDGDEVARWYRNGKFLNPSSKGWSLVVGFDYNEYPTQVIDPLIERAVKAGGTIEFISIVEGTGKTRRAEMVVAGMESVKLFDGSQRMLRRVEERIDGKVGRRFWIDEKGQRIVTNYNGPVAYRASEAEARRGCPKDWPTLDSGR